IFPGSAQWVAGNRFLATFGIFVSTLVWAAILVLFWFVIFDRTQLLNLGTQVTTDSHSLILIQVLSVVLCAFWIVFWIDTIRLIQFRRIAKVSRWFIAIVALVSVVLSSGGAFFISQLSGTQRELIEKVFINEVVHEPAEGRYNIMLLGGDAGEGRW